MIRAFTTAPIADDELTTLLDLARRAPSAGNTAATEFVVLTGEAKQRYWNLTLPGERRESFAFPTLPDSHGLILVLTTPDAYAERYAEPDKARTGLGEATDAWPVPFWWVDAGAVIQNLLLLTRERGLGACLFGVFEHEGAVRDEFGIPNDRRIVAAIAIGHPATDPGRAGRSAGRDRPATGSIIHRQRWNPDG